MITPVNYYRYVISDRLGIMQVSPLGESDFTIEYDREDEGKLDYSKKMGAKIVFIGPAYQNMLKLETSIYRCDYVTISIERRCVSGGLETWTPWHTGRMSFNDGTWDLDRCQVEIKLDDLKPDQCYDDNKTTEINIFAETSTRRTVSLSDPSLMIERISYSHTVPLDTGDCDPYYWGGTGIPADGGWGIVSYVISRNSFENTCSVSSDYAREFIYVNCASPGPSDPEWVLVEDLCPTGQRKYARPARTYGCTYFNSNLGENPQINSQTCLVVGDTSTDQSIDNGVLLEEIIQAFISRFCNGLNFVSNFFQFNPDVVSTINYVTGQASKTSHITVYQKSDVKRPNVSGNATRANISWEKLFDALVKMFNLRWRIENGILRMEHVSYFSKTAGRDLTQPKYYRQMIGKRKYTYDTAEIPKQEVFTFMEASVGDFQGVPIIYSGGCVTASSRENTKNYAVENVTTDVELCLANPDPDSKVVDDEGFVIMATDTDNGTDYYLITESPIFGGASLNNSLAWAQLHRDYYKWDRPLRNGNMNGVNTTFLTVKPTKKGEEITIPYCCDDPEFNPDDTITTGLGIGIVDKSTFSFKSETLKLELLYEADFGLVGNNPPVAVNDIVNAYKNQPNIINVLVNDTDSDGVILSVEVIGLPNHGTAVVQPDNTILYTPATDYVGNDVFVYRIYDDWNQFSNNALVSVTVFGNQPPIAVNDTYTATKNTPLTIAAPGVFANDSDDVSFSLDIYDATGTSGGTMALASDGSFTYTPVTGFVGSDVFNYRIKDGLGLTSTATITIEVRDLANPIAVDDSYSTTANSVLNVAAPGLLSNDTTPDTLAASSGSISTTQGGSVSISSDGSFSYTPPVGFIGTDGFDYTALSASGSDIGHATIFVRPKVYVHFQYVNGMNYSINKICQGLESNAGNGSSAIIRLFFYSDAAGTIPLNVTGFGLEVYYKITGAFYGMPGTYENIGSVNPTGSQFDIFTGQYEYFRMETQCDDTVVYKNESISLEPRPTYIII